MIKLSNITDDNHKEELKDMIINHYKESYGEELVDKYLTYLEKYPQNKVRDWLINDLKNRFSSKEEHLKKDMSLLYDEQDTSKDIAFGIFNDDLLMGYLFLSVHMSYDNHGNETDRYGELYDLYIKPEYRDVLTNNRDELVTSIRTYLENYYKENNVKDILTRIPSDIEDLVLLGKEFGFTKEEHINNNTKDLWKKTI